MSPRVPQPLGAQELDTVRCVLAGFWSPLPTDVEVLGALPGGYLNRMYLIRRGLTRFVLRRYDYNTQQASINYEHRLLRSLPSRVHRAAIAKPIAATAGETVVAVDGHHYALFPFIAGEQFDYTNPRLLAEAGHTLAAYHNAVRSYFPVPRQRPHYGTVACLDWVALHTSGVVELLHTVAALPVRDRREQLIFDALELLLEEATTLEATLTEDVYAGLPQLVIHNDFGPHNLLCQADHIAGVLDFDLAVWDARAYDLAAALMWLSEDAALPSTHSLLTGDRPWSLNAERAQPVFRAYAATIDPPLLPGEMRMLPWFMRAFGLWQAVWYLDARIAGFEWYPEEISGLVACLRRFHTRAEEYVAAIVNDLGPVRHSRHPGGMVCS